MSSHEYRGHAIRVEARPGAARPWGVWVDGVELFGQGDRVRRRLAYGTAAAALDAGKRYVRALPFEPAGRPYTAGARPVEVGSAAHRLTQAVSAMLERPPVVPNIYPCGCSRLKVNAGRCDRYKPWELP